MSATALDPITINAPTRDAESITAGPTPTWIQLRPTVISDRRCRLILRRCVRLLAGIERNDPKGDHVAVARADAVDRATSIRARVAVPLIACIHVFCDLRVQGWEFRVDRRSIAVRAPGYKIGSVDEEKARVRATHTVDRDVQLSQSAVRRFVREVERTRLVGSDWKSILSLVRDGRGLAAELREVSKISNPLDRLEALTATIDPYVQVVRPNATCEFTGLKLADIWRYFRHTWTTTYQSTPGRKLYFLVRDRAAPNHPVVGIGGLGSAIVQLSVRDEWIGWTGNSFTNRLGVAPTARWTRWIHGSLSSLISSILTADLIRDRVVSRSEIASPTPQAIKRLRSFAREERRLHRLFPERSQHKRLPHHIGHDGAQNWKRQASTHLFRSKRAGSLGELLDARRKLDKAVIGRGRSRQLAGMMESADAKAAVQTVLRYMKAAHVGVNMMDITVCGAIAPYNELLAGKLVSLLMASPDVIRAYKRRYAAAASVIASSMAGKPVRRAPQLVLLGTTSLYGIGASQYNRIRVPADAAGGQPGDRLEFIACGQTAGYGSYHFSRETMSAFDLLLRRLGRGRPVNSIFGEGVNPKLRKVRGGLDAIGLSSDQLLQHGSPRLVYVIPLANNFREVLIGVDRRPRYIVPQSDQGTQALIDYWRLRWLDQRMAQPAILDRVAEHSLSHPVRHGARVLLPDVSEEGGLEFDATPDVGDWAV